MRIAYLLLPFLIACDSVTSPDRNRDADDAASRIRFVLDEASCRGAISLDFLIDQEVAGVKFLAAGDSADFKAKPGMHTVQARATRDGPGAFGEWPSVDVEAPVRVVLSCWSL